MAETERLPEEFLESMAEVIRLIGHPLRLRILEYLDLHGESTVSEIISGITGPQSAVSQHLNKMRLAGIVACRREGRQIFYRIAAVNAVTILNCLRGKYRSLRESGSPERRA
ncbi:helix-turn-helix transcriptional regulator [uncultured Victivallis sp.]|uniref:ArsR/SmtB family transcription factor n=1 Tax=uncultured Victivallis sp. TaxID=354118 RepID=UPI0025EF9298|nr:metalloregulator ArsR/SmtB family transcription factor [uncultured Victivallis sp.]